LGQISQETNICGGVLKLGSLLVLGRVSQHSAILGLRQIRELFQSEKYEQNNR